MQLFSGSLGSEYMAWMYLIKIADYYNFYFDRPWWTFYPEYTFNRLKADAEIPEHLTLNQYKQWETSRTPFMDWTAGFVYAKLRDDRLFNVIEQSLSDYNTVVARYGLAHLIALKQDLDVLLGEPVGIHGIRKHGPIESFENYPFDYTRIYPQANQNGRQDLEENGGKILLQFTQEVKNIRVTATPEGTFDVAEVSYLGMSFEGLWQSLFSPLILYKGSNSQYWIETPKYIRAF